MRTLSALALCLISSVALADPAPATTTATTTPAATTPAATTPAPCTTIDTWSKEACAGKVEEAKLVLAACDAELARLKTIRAEARAVAGVDTQPATLKRSGSNRMEAESNDE